MLKNFGFQFAQILIAQMLHETSGDYRGNMLLPDIAELTDGFSPAPLKA